MSEKDLTTPDRDELRELLTREDLRSLYLFLFDRREKRPTMVEIRAHAAEANGESHSQTDRRVRESRDWFRLPAVRTGRVHVYQLAGRADEIQGRRSGISPKVRGEVLRAKRCAQCGNTPAEDDLKLEVDHPAAGQHRRHRERPAARHAVRPRQESVLLIDRPVR